MLMSRTMQSLAYYFRKLTGVQPRRLSAALLSPLVSPGAPPLWIHQSRPLFPPLPAVGQLLDASRQEGERAEALGLLLPLEDTAQGELLRQLKGAEIEQFIKADQHPLPATEDREGYYGDQHVRYWISGLGDYILMKTLLREQQVTLRSQGSLLDLGCASGRVLRHFAIQETGLRVYGADINQINIQWIRKHLPPSIFCFQNTVLPHLPLADGSLDFVYGCSVFTHIDDYEEAWLLELRRVLKPGGLAFITVHSERTWEQMRVSEDHFVRKYFLSVPHVIEDRGPGHITADFFQQEMPAERLVFTNITFPINNTNVFHTSAYIKERWGRFFKVLKIIPKAHGGHQDGVLLLKE